MPVSESDVPYPVIDGRKPDFVEDFAADRVVATGDDDGFARLHHLAEFCGTSHFVRPFLT